MCALFSYFCDRKKEHVSVSGHGGNKDGDERTQITDSSAPFRGSEAYERASKAKII